MSAGSLGPLQSSSSSSNLNQTLLASTIRGEQQNSRKPEFQVDDRIPYTGKGVCLNCGLNDTYNIKLVRPKIERLCFLQFKSFCMRTLVEELLYAESASLQVRSQSQHVTFLILK